VQLEIAWRGLQLLRVGGVMCYSTCSLNPIEDEAVVAELLRRSSINGGEDRSVSLVPWPRNILGGLKRRPGVSTWRVADFEEDDEGEDVRIRWHSSWEEAEKVHMEHAVKSLWPQESNQNLCLDLCSRFLPHDQNTGGFFVALLKKEKELPSAKQTGMRKTKIAKEEEANVQRVSNAVVDKLAATYDLKPSTAGKRLRCKDVESHRIQLVPAELNAFEQSYSAMSGNAITVHSAGIDLFERDNSSMAHKVVPKYGEKLLKTLKKSR